MPHVNAEILDKDTLSVNGTLFVRKSGDEVLLQPMNKAVAPRLRCSNCGFNRQYTYWYSRLDFKDRIVNFCPSCGLKVAGAIGTEVDG